MNLTFEDTVQRHRELWDWLSKNPNSTKGSWPGWMDAEPVVADCFFCEYDQNNPGAKPCGHCPAEFKENGKPKGFTSYCLGGLFYKWRNSTDLEERARLAAQIRDIPVSKKETK